MLGVYSVDSGKIIYNGNRLLEPIADVEAHNFTPKTSQRLLNDLATDKHLYHLHRIDNAIFNAAVDYFRSIGATWCNLPLTTKMISSPGEVYAGKKLNYTTDALPVTLEWFDRGSIFLTESSQFYLELRLLIDSIDKVFSIYNTFRKEPADFSHLSEFQHIEFEGRVSFEENTDIYKELVRYITKYVLKNNYQDLSYYLTDIDLEELSNSFDETNIETMTFINAMSLLANKVGKPEYKQNSLRDFGAYEEIALTRLVGRHCNIVEFPLEEIPFYHDSSFKDGDGRLYAKNADFILLGYRETIGSGQRITDIDAIKQKAKFFNLPEEDYEPYINLRSMPTYRSTCGFGMGWQRYTQWLLKLPFIWEASHMPRGHFEPRP